MDIFLCAKLINASNGTDFYVWFYWYARTRGSVLICSIPLLRMGTYSGDEFPFQYGLPLKGSYPHVKHFPYVTGLSGRALHSFLYFSGPWMLSIARSW